MHLQAHHRIEIRVDLVVVEQFSRPKSWAQFMPKKSYAQPPTATGAGRLMSGTRSGRTPMPRHVREPSVVGDGGVRP